MTEGTQVFSTARRRKPIAKAIVRWTFRLAFWFFAAIGLMTVVYYAGFDYSRIVSYSMSPTLKGTNWDEGDRVLSEKISFRFRRPRRWEVICYRRDDGARIMKRVVGLPGEKVVMRRGGRIFIDGKELPVPEHLRFLRYFPFGNLTDDEKPYDCGDGYYVLGDYAKDSDDSRFNGAVAPERIIGRPWIIVGPSGRRGFVR